MIPVCKIVNMYMRKLQVVTGHKSQLSPDATPSSVPSRGLSLSSLANRLAATTTWLSRRGFLCAIITPVGRPKRHASRVTKSCRPGEVGGLSLQPCATHGIVCFEVSIVACRSRYLTDNGRRRQRQNSIDHGGVLRRRCGWMH